MSSAHDSAAVSVAPARALSHPEMSPNSRLLQRAFWSSMKMRKSSRNTAVIRSNIINVQNGADATCGTFGLPKCFCVNQLAMANKTRESVFLRF
jgi:hypothetical protein